MSRHYIDEELLTGPTLPGGRPRFDVVVGWNPARHDEGSYFCQLWDNSIIEESEKVIWSCGEFGEFPELESFLEEIRLLHEAAPVFPWPLPEDLISELIEDKLDNVSA